MSSRFLLVAIKGDSAVLGIEKKLLELHGNGYTTLVLLVSDIETKSSPGIWHRVNTLSRGEEIKARFGGYDRYISVGLELYGFELASEENFDSLFLAKLNTDLNS